MNFLPGCLRLSPMNVREIQNVLETQVHTTDPNLDLELSSACGADLMSDVMAFVKEDVVLLTGLVNIQTVRTAVLLDIQVVVFVRGKVPDPDMVAEAQKAGIILMTTNYSLFLACGRLYEAGLRKGGTRVIGS